MVLVQKELKNAYIGEKPWWKPWANTLLYYPLTENLADASGHWNTWTMTWTCSFNSSTGIHVTWKSSNYVTWMSIWVNARNTFTLNVWCKYDSVASWVQTLWGNSSNTQNYQAMKEELVSWDGLYIWCSVWSTNVWGKVGETSVATTFHNICVIANWTTYKFYFNGVLKKQTTNSGSVNNYWTMNLWYDNYYTSGRAANGYIKDYIVESVARTEQEVLDYYNWTKWDYWL